MFLSFFKAYLSATRTFVGLDIFVRLTRVDDEGALGGEQRDTRRRIGWEELASAGDGAGVDALVQ